MKNLRKWSINLLSEFFDKTNKKVDLNLLTFNFIKNRQFCFFFIHTKDAVKQLEIDFILVFFFSTIIQQIQFLKLMFRC